MIIILVVALLLVTAVSAFIAGRLIECGKRLVETQGWLAESRLETKAYQNQSFAKQGMPPLFASDGTVKFDDSIDNTPVSQILRPPFAQAELDWENEEELPITSNQALRSFTYITPLTDEQKSEMMKEVHNIRG